jgi:transposase
MLFTFSNNHFCAKIRKDLINLAQKYMFKSKSEFTNSLFGSYAYNPIITRHRNHLLVRMESLIDWSFVEEEVRDCYSTVGQHAYNPVLLLKLLVIQQLYDLSERDTCVNTDCNLIFRYFVGLGLDQETPHWTELGKFKTRIGTERFENLFYRLLDEAERLGITISKQRIVDATDVQANVDLARVAKCKKDGDDHDYIDRGTTDPDAKFGSKGKGKKSWYGFKSSTNLDPESELVTAVETTDGAVPDGQVLTPLIDKEREHRGEDAIRQQGGDKGYVGNTET